MEINKQQTVADILHQYKDAFIVGLLNEYEMSKKILDAIRFLDMPQHECQLDEWLCGKCDDPSHDYELVEQRPQSESAEYRTANS